MITMRAVVQNAYGPPGEVLDTGDRPVPEPGPDEVVVRVVAASVHPDVWHAVTGLPYVLRIMGSGLRRPKVDVPGTDLAGIVSAVGDDVDGLAIGDRVYGESLIGHQWKNAAAYAEYVAVRATSLAPLPPNLDFVEAAAIPTSAYIAAMNMAHLVRPGDKVLVNGAGGGVGMFVMQIAKAAGATVTGVDTTSKQDLLRELGADHVVDYTNEDFALGEERYNLIVDIPGNRTFEDLARVLADDGVYVLIGHESFSKRRHRLLGATMPRYLRMFLTAPFGRGRRRPKLEGPRPDHREVVWDLAAQGALRPVIEPAEYGLEDVEAALDHLVAGTAMGRIMLRISEG